MPKRILLADDSITIQKVVELTFSDGDYEVVAVNNGAKAIQKLSEMRPDIILSDIIMPEKNGYEVCEFVKSHPEFRNIPVVLLTGTFEPFDPDRADKAGCDAVVTKPFESQSLIHKVEELIDQAKSATAAPAAASAPLAPEPPAFAVPTFDSPFASNEPSTMSFPVPPPFAPEPAAPPAFQANDNDIFGAPPPVASPTTEMPFDNAAEPAFGGETRAFPRMSFADLEKMAATPPAAPPPPPAPEPASPWDEPAATAGETRAFPRMSFEELQQMPSPSQPVHEPAPPAPEPASPWDAPASTGGETRAFPMMSLDELQKMAGSPAPHPEPTPPALEPASPWDESPAAAGETRAFPRMSFDELQKINVTPIPEPAPPAPEPASPWDEPAPTGGETRAFPRMTFEELQQMAASPVAAPAAEAASPWDEPAVPAAEDVVPTEAPSPFAEPLATHDESPFAAEPEPLAAVPAAEPLAEEPPVWSPGGVHSEPAVETAVAAAADMSALPDHLTDDQVDRIARRVVQLMSAEIVRNIAWEVIPDLAEMAVKERIRQLEAE